MTKKKSPINKITKNNNQIIEVKEFQRIVKKIPICTVDVVIFNKDLTKTLIFKRKNNPLRGKFYSCGGRLFKNEALLNCAIRKVNDELGIAVDRKKIFFGGCMNEIFSNSVFKNINYHAVNVYYGFIFMETENIKIKLDNQHSTYRWLDLKDNSLHPFLKEKINNLKKNYDKKLNKN
jgi:colanic acid biosynthesis protein WcaH